MLCVQLRQKQGRGHNFYNIFRFRDVEMRDKWDFKIMSEIGRIGSTVMLEISFNILMLHCALKKSSSSEDLTIT